MPDADTDIDHDRTTTDETASHPGETEEDRAAVERPEVIRPDEPSDAEHADPAASDDEAQPAITEPAKVMRIGSMVKQLLEEVRETPLDPASRGRLAEVYERSVTELADALSPDLQHELRMLALPFEHDDVPSEAEIRVAKAQLVGWLEGLFHGIQASLMAQQVAARQQLEQMRQLNPGHVPGQPPQQGPAQPAQGERPGTYL